MDSIDERKKVIDPRRAKAHLRTSGHNTRHQGFHTLEQAEKYIRSHTSAEYVRDITSDAEDTTPGFNKIAYYAVANGRSPGVTQFFK